MTTGRINQVACEGGTQRRAKAHHTDSLQRHRPCCDRTREGLAPHARPIEARARGYYSTPRATQPAAALACAVVVITCDRGTTTRTPRLETRTRRHPRSPHRCATSPKPRSRGTQGRRCVDTEASVHSVPLSTCWARPTRDFLRTSGRPSHAQTSRTTPLACLAAACDARALHPALDKPSSCHVRLAAVRAPRCAGSNARARAGPNPTRAHATPAARLGLHRALASVVKSCT